MIVLRGYRGRVVGHESAGREAHIDLLGFGYWVRAAAPGNVPGGGSHRRFISCLGDDKRYGALRRADGGCPPPTIGCTGRDEGLNGDFGIVTRRGGCRDHCRIADRLAGDCIRDLDVRVDDGCAATVRSGFARGRSGDKTGKREQPRIQAHCPSLACGASGATPWAPRMVPADAAHVHRVLARRGERHREGVALAVIDDFHARRSAEDFPGARLTQRITQGEQAS